MDRCAEFKASIAASDAEAQSIEVQMAVIRADIDERVAALRAELATRLDSPAAKLAAARQTGDLLRRAQGVETDRLLGAAEAGGGLTDAKSALDAGANPDGRTPATPRTPLVCAAASGDLAVAALLLDRGADPNKARNTGAGPGQTPLFVAALNGDLDMATLLLDRGADPNKARTDTGATPLYAAVQYGHLDVAQLLASSGANVAVTSRWGTTLHEAAVVEGHADIAAFLAVVATWPAFKIAVACRLVDVARSGLRLGRIDPADCALAGLVVVGTSPAGQLWPGSPGPCPRTTQLVKDGLAGWSPSRHFLFHPGVRSTVRTVLMVSRRVRNRHTVMARLVANLSPWVRQMLGAMPPVGLPDELWHVICSFLRRKD